jgi:hypothetical protein
MNKFILLFFVTATNIAFADVQISEDIQKALKKWDANFQVFPLKSFPPTVIGLFRDAKNESPMAVSGDFNGDGQTDFAIMGFNKTQQKIVILVKQEKDYIPVLVNTEKYKDPEKSFLDTEDTGREKGLSTYVSLLSAKDIEVGKKSTFAKKPDALQIENYGGVTTAYYLKSTSKNKFEVKEYKGMINE